MKGHGVMRGLWVAGAGVATAACVLADPPATLPEVPEGPPDIQTTSVLPSTSQVQLTIWPRDFIIPVLLIEPAELEWRAAFNYSPLSASAAQIYSGVASGSDVDGIVTVSVPTLPAPLGPGCSTVTIVVAYGFVSETLTPDSRGGSSVSWLYAPNGECPAYDASALANVRFAEAGSGGD
jgi:hypothetical protein